MDTSLGFLMLDPSFRIFTVLKLATMIVKLAKNTINTYSLPSKL